MTDERLEEIKQIVLNIYKTLDITDFPIDLNHIIDSYGIQLYEYSTCGRELCLKYSEDSFSFGSKIFYDERMYSKRIRFSIAHEIGHIMLNHTRLEENKRIEEEEADRFAACLLIPIVAVARIDYISVEILMQHFDISKQAANIAYYEYTHRYRGYHNLGKSDKELFNHLFDDTYVKNQYSYKHISKTESEDFIAAENNWLYGIYY